MHPIKKKKTTTKNKQNNKPNQGCMQTWGGCKLQKYWGERDYPSKTHQFWSTCKLHRVILVNFLDFVIFSFIVLDFFFRCAVLFCFCFFGCDIPCICTWTEQKAKLKKQNKTKTNKNKELLVLTTLYSTLHFFLAPPLLWCHH